MVLEIKGDITETPIETIAHGVNCQGAMGSGVARALFERWPEVKQEYHKEYNSLKDVIGDHPEFHLGKAQKVICYENRKIQTPGKTVYNMFTQLEYGPGDKQYVDYAAVLSCFNKLPNYMSCIAIPKIGAGLAGGDWGIIKNIIVETTQKKGIDLVIYSLK